MGKAPVTVPIPLLIFKDIRVLGFWISGTLSEKLGLEVRVRHCSTEGSVLRCNSDR